MDELSKEKEKYANNDDNEILEKKASPLRSLILHICFLVETPVKLSTSHRKLDFSHLNWNDIFNSLYIIKF